MQLLNWFLKMKWHLDAFLFQEMVALLIRIAFGSQKWVLLNTMMVLVADMVLVASLFVLCGSH